MRGGSWVSFFLLVVSAWAEPTTASRHVVVVVWDGLRPDSVSAQLTPNLWRLAQRGVTFAHHHPVYLSATEVNGTAMATGAYPAHSTVIANTDFRPAIDPQSAIGIEVPANVRTGDKVTGGHYLNRLTIAEILHARGMRTAIAGSKQVALLQDRTLREDGASPIVFEGAALPLGLAANLPPFPPVAADENKVARDAWTTRVLIEKLWQPEVPAYSLLWLAEPDASQHATGPGSAESLAGVASSDRNLGAVIDALTQRDLLPSTDIFVVSDHGFSTIGRKVDVAAELSRAGFNATRRAAGGLASGQIMVVGNGGATLLYVGGHDTAVVRRVVEFLQTQDWTGVVLSRTPWPGTFPLSATHDDSPAAPDVIVSLRWTAQKSATGMPGIQVSDVGPASKKKGNHASLSAYDMHNTLIAAGPDFRLGVTTTLPTANTDLAPTILWCLGLSDAVPGMDGRVLTEALTIAGPPLQSHETKRLSAQNGRWHQYLVVSRVNDVDYIDEGNGEIANE